ncbi:PREDICTED: deoxyribonuclease-1-like 1 [Lipotes vexillifer]|uniref:Deoxyribonuclease-1-like 1 n=1 Tax=Lipotes vexillifer TaxID=118797 RepID=A0A340XBR1_LIPVE|nr:PREDICTED: deoxyribonuclease-1-like 1 [Lipotes vexillifer]
MASSCADCHSLWVFRALRSAQPHRARPEDLERRRPGTGAERRAWESAEQSLRSGGRSSSPRALGTGKTLTHSSVIYSNPPWPLPPLAPCPTRADAVIPWGVAIRSQHRKVVWRRPVLHSNLDSSGGFQKPIHGHALLLLLLLAGGADTFHICAFNTQRLTLSKVAREPVLDTLVQILARCDITVLQEVVDSTGSAIPLLLRELNRFDDSGPYSFLSSHLLGRGTYKEKYVYIYRSHKTQVLDSYVYDDQNDLFAREPFVCQFSLPSKVLPSLVLVSLHTTPKAVETELNALYHVFLDASQRWQSEDVILLGDFNADCASLTKKRLDDLVLRTQAGFHWAIPDGVDTTVRASTHCTYDRIVLHGEHLQSMLRGAAAFDFPQSFGLTEEEALNISDHYPVEVELSYAVHGAQPLSLATLLLSLLLLLSPQLGLVA